MNVTIARSTLADALKVVMPAVDKGGHRLPILAGVRLVYEDDGVTFTATNLDLTIEHHISPEPSITGKDGAVVVPAQLLANIVGAMAGDLVMIDGDGIDVTVSSGDTSATLRTLPIMEWPQGLEAAGQAVVLDEAAMAALAHIVKFCSADDARGFLKGVHFGPEGIMATDSYRAISYGAVQMPEATVPVETITAILRATSEAVVFTAGERTASFGTDDTTWTSSLLSGEYPAAGILRLIGEAGDEEVTVDRDELIGALGRVAALGSTRAVLTLDAGRLVVSAAESEVGEITDTVGGDGKRAEPVMFDAEYLAAVAAAAADGDLVLRCNGTKQAVVTSGDLAMMVMPILITASA